MSAASLLESEDVSVVFARASSSLLQVFLMRSCLSSEAFFRRRKVLCNPFACGGSTCQNTDAFVILPTVFCAKNARNEKTRSVDSDGLKLRVVPVAFELLCRRCFRSHCNNASFRVFLFEIMLAVLLPSTARPAPLRLMKL
jgi:hypothetical protein